MRGAWLSFSWRRMSTEIEHEPLMSWPKGEDSSALRQRLLEQRIVLLGGSLDDDAASELISELLLLSSADPRAEIRLYINSSGGPAGAFLAVYDTVQSLAAPVATICISQARGTAALLLAAGAVGKRLAFQNSLVLMKSPDEHLDGLDNIKAQVEAARRRKQSLMEIAVRHTDLDAERITGDLDRGVLLRADEAKEYGIIDAVIDPGHPYFFRFPLPPPPSGNGE
jgi:ATP-dependent Clp protease, protease subunit